MQEGKQRTYADIGAGDDGDAGGGCTHTSAVQGQVYIELHYFCTVYM